MSVMVPEVGHSSRHAMRVCGVLGTKGVLKGVSRGAVFVAVPCVAAGPIVGTRSMLRCRRGATSDVRDVLRPTARGSISGSRGEPWRADTFRSAATCDARGQLAGEACELALVHQLHKYVSISSGDGRLLVGVVARPAEPKVPGGLDHFHQPYLLQHVQRPLVGLREVHRRLTPPCVRGGGRVKCSVGTTCQSSTVASSASARRTRSARRSVKSVAVLLMAASILNF